VGGRVNPKRNQRPGGIGLVRPVIDYQPLVQPPQQIDPAPRCIHRHSHFLSEVGIDQLLARPLRQQCREGLQRRQFLQLRDLERITVDPEQCRGKPCIRGLRVRVKDILEMLGSGMTEADILAEFPYLESGDLRAAQLYAARLTIPYHVTFGVRSSHALSDRRAASAVFGSDFAGTRFGGPPTYTNCRCRTPRSGHLDVRVERELCARDQG